MKTDIHPQYSETTVVCSCGNTFVTRSTKPGELHVELCNECHPFYTGKQKLVDSGGRVERFQKRYGTTKLQSRKARRATEEAAEAAATEEAAEEVAAEAPADAGADA